ncbi:MAG: nicotinate-nucleotide adenylyltransferase [Bacteroidales bacterium]|nr:nicotinate-nucleotide adenylyltransferase [Bacteroidales bacterium]
MKNIGLFFGSFNPIHIGHLAIANYMVEFSDLNEVWFVVSPHNPLKEKKSLLAFHHRFDMVHQAIEADTRFTASNVETNMPRPSFTIDTMAYLTGRYPTHKFSIIMGADGLPTFHKWKNQEEIIKNHKRYVYPRPGIVLDGHYEHKNMEVVSAPMIEISSSFIRESIKQGKDMRYFMPQGVFEYIEKMNLYKS